MKIHLGCGKSRRDGYIGIDIATFDSDTIRHDLNKFPYPFKENSISEVLMSNVLEHLPNTIRVMEEIWRICIDGAIVNISVPYYNAVGAFQDPTHITFFTENTFDYFTVDGDSTLSCYNYYTTARYKKISIRPMQRGVLDMLPDKLQWFLAHHFATVHGLEIKLSVVK